MKYLKSIFLVILFFTLTAGNIHKFYVSTTQIEYAEQEESLQIIVKIFIDDIEAVLRERYNKPEMELASKKETEEDAELIKQYILKKLHIQVNHKEMPLTYIGKEYDIDVLKAYIEINQVSSLQLLEIENKLLMEKFPKQQNIIHFKWGKNRNSLLLNIDNPKGLLKFE